MANLTVKRHLITVAALLALAVPLAACDKVAAVAEKAANPQFKAVDITGAEYAKGFSLPDADGRVRTMADFKGKVVVVFFGYVQCPDVCPTTMAEMALIKKQLGADGARVQVVFITLDPERDTADILKAYAANFGPDFVALRGDNEQTKVAAMAYKVFYSRVRGATPQTYTIDHTAGSYVHDRDGRIRLFVRYGAKTEDLQADLKLLLR